MNELPDDQLDKLFRKSAEEFEPEFNPQAWIAMRKKLDEEDGKGGIAWWKVAILGLLLLGIGVGGYYFWPEKTEHKNGNFSSNSTASTETQPSEQAAIRSNSEKISLKSSQTEQEVASMVKERVQRNSQNKVIRQNVPLENPQVREQASTKKADIPPYENDPVLSHSIKNRRIVEAIKQAGRNSSKVLVSNRNVSKGSLNQKGEVGLGRNTINKNKGNSNSAERRGNKYSESQSVTNYSSVKTTSTGQTASVELSTSASEILPKENTRYTFSNFDELSIHGWQLLKLPVPALLIDYQIPHPPVVPQKEESVAVFQKGLSARIMAAPDLSFIATNQMMKNPTLALSIMLEYRFSRRLTVQAGAVRSVKLYTATGEQYQWPETWNSQKARPTEIGANCKVLDIPLNLRYDLSQGTKSRWFIASGVSSYLMLNEKYDYIYPPHTYGIKWKTWEGSTGNYWLGVMNLSVGFERQLGRNLSIQAEPYFKLPLAEVGMGKIKLNTSGIFISARYKLGRF